MRCRWSIKRAALAVVVSAFCVAPAGAAGGLGARDLSEATLEDLMNIEVTTVSKKEQKVSQSAAAIYVITQEDIRRSGMSSVPELLRMVPGLQVAQAQGGQWAISARQCGLSIFRSNVTISTAVRAASAPLGIPSLELSVADWAAQSSRW